MATDTHITAFAGGESPIEVLHRLGLEPDTIPRREGESWHVALGKEWNRTIKRADLEAIDLDEDAHLDALFADRDKRMVAIETAMLEIERDDSNGIAQMLLIARSLMDNNLANGIADGDMERVSSLINGSVHRAQDLAKGRQS